MVAIANCLRDPSSLVRDAAAECLYKLHAPTKIMLWGRPDKFIVSFWRISSQVIFTLAKQLLDNRERESGLRHLLDLLKRLLTSRNQFLEQHRDVAARGIDTRERLQASISLEVALLILLCSYDTDICKLSIDCFGLLCTEVHLTERLDDPQPSSITIVENMAYYTELTKNADVVTGRKSLQRRIRRLLCMTNHSSPGMLAAWEEAWKRWKLLTPLIIRSSEESSTKDESSMLEGKKASGATWHEKLRSNSSRHLPQPISASTRMDFIDDDRSAEWQNYGGFLAALGGVCVMQETSSALLSVPPSPSASVRSRTNNDTPIKTHTRHISAPIESAGMVDRFIMEMIDLLACDNLIVREWIREILGNDLSPALYHIMFRHLETVLSKCFVGPDNSDPICSSKYTLFVEQAISVLKQVLDRFADKTGSLFTVDFSTLIKQSALYLNKLGPDQLSIKIKIKMCQLVEVLMSKKDMVILRQEFGLRNKLLEIIVEWTSDFALVN
jgi:neurofibromin 1